MQQIKLVNPCTVNLSAMQPSTDGYFCSSCQKNVVDYSNMTNDQMMNHIQKHGIGCGVWRQDQLNSPLKSQGRRKFNLRLFYAALISMLWLRSVEAKGQSVPDTVQTTCKPNNYQKLEQPQFDTAKAIDTDPTLRYFGTGNIKTTTIYKQIPLTPIYVCWGRRHGKSRIMFGHWYIPYINKPK